MFRVADTMKDSHGPFDRQKVADCSILSSPEASKAVGLLLSRNMCHCLLEDICYMIFDPSNFIMPVHPFGFFDFRPEDDQRNDPEVAASLEQGVRAM